MAFSFEAREEHLRLQLCNLMNFYACGWAPLYIDFSRGLNFDSCA